MHTNPTENLHNTKFEVNSNHNQNFNAQINFPHQSTAISQG